MYVLVWDAFLLMLKRIQIISRTEKENFGLKLKIHFLEDLLNKSDPNLNHKALKENTDLRVDRATLQRDLAKVKKQLGASARDAEELRRQLLADTTRAEQQLAEKTVENELRTLRASLEGKQGEIEDLREVLAASERDEEVGELKETIDDLEATLRDKDRIIEDLKDKEVSCKAPEGGKLSLTWFYRRSLSSKNKPCMS